MAAKRRRPPQVGTIGSTIAAGLRMTIYCDVGECHHNQTLDLEALARELGRDYRIADFVARSRCSKCGARWPQRAAPIRSMPPLLCDRCHVTVLMAILGHYSIALTNQSENRR